MKLYRTFASFALVVLVLSPLWGAQHVPSTHSPAGSSGTGLFNLEDVLRSDGAGETGPDVNGVLGPLFSMHKDAIHNGILWKGDHPYLLFMMNGSPFTGLDYADPYNILEKLAEPNVRIAPFTLELPCNNIEVGGRGCRRSGTLAFALNDERPKNALFPQFGGNATAKKLQLLWKGGLGFDHITEGSIATKFINEDLPRENVQSAEIPEMFEFDQDNPKFFGPDLTEDDARLNGGAFEDQGFSVGLRYNLFCGGNVSLADGRWLHIGGDDKGDNSGLRKLNIYDNERGEWVERVATGIVAAYKDDPENLKPEIHPDPRDETVSDPADPSDMTDQRWYPTGVTLPDGRVLLIGGTDADTTAPFPNSTRRHSVIPEIYDPATDTTTALWTAQKHFGFFPHCFVVEHDFGRSPEDNWGVACKQESVKGDPLYADPDDPNTMDRAALATFNYNPWGITGVLREARA